MRVGYARVSTDDQDTTSQRQALTAAGCEIVYQDIASGGDRARPELARCLERLKRGDTLVVARLDRIARSLMHLLSIVEDLEGRGVAFRSLADPFDTGSAQGRLMMQILGAFAEFERHLIRERTKAGLAIAKSKGKVAGNPRMRANDPTAIASMRASQADTYLQRSREASVEWIDLVRRMRPHAPWNRVAATVFARSEAKHGRGKGRGIAVETLKAHVKRLVKAGDLPPAVLDRAPMPGAADKDAAHIALREIRNANPDASLRRLALLLTEAGYLPPRASAWSAGTIKAMLDR